MPNFQRTSEGKAVIYERSTGQAIERWPVDARGMIESGEYTADTHDQAIAPAASVTPPAPSVPETEAIATEAAPKQVAPKPKRERKQRPKPEQA